MDWIQVLTIAGSVIGASWAMHRQTFSEMKDFHNRMADFHGRLCTLEEKYRQMMERYLEERTKK